MADRYVTFFSPGEFFAEQTTLPILSFDPELARKMAINLKRDQNIVSYAFVFCFEDKTPVSQNYFLGGKVSTYEEICSRTDSESALLRFHMEQEGWDRVLVNERSWAITQPLKPGDRVLDYI